MHTKHFCWDGIAVIVIGSYSLFATGVPILPWMGPHVSYNSTWQLSSSARLQWQHVIIGQRTLTWWYMDVCINVYSTTVAPSPLVQNIHPFQLPGCDVSILTNWPPSSSQFQVVVSSESKLHWILITPLLTDKICNEQTNLHHLSDWWNQTISMNHEMRLSHTYRLAPPLAPGLHDIRARYLLYLLSLFPLTRLPVMNQNYYESWM